MTDPAVEAAQRAWVPMVVRCGEPPVDLAPVLHDLGRDSAREALAPIRAVAERYLDDYIGGFSIDDLITDLKPFIYTTEELNGDS